MNFEVGDFAVGDQFKQQIGMGNYQGDSGHISFNTNFNSKIVNNVNGQELFEDTGFFDSLYKLKNALESHNKTEIAEVAEELDTLEEGIQTKVTKTGVNLNRLEIAENNLTALSENVLASIESIENIDLVDVASRFTQAENALTASITALSKVFPQSLLSLL